MKIAYLIQYFGPPDNSFASARSYDFVREWAKQGHSVWVICSDAYLLDKKKAVFFNDLPIEVTVIHQPYKNDFGFRARVQAFLIFALKAFLVLLKHPEKWQFLYASSTPLTVAFVGWVQKWITHKKWALELRDLWPDFPLEVTGLRQTRIGLIAHWFEKKIYQSAEFVVCLSPLAKKILIDENRIEPQKLVLIPNGCSEIELQRSIETSQRWFTGFYEGALGKANDIPWLLTFIDIFIKSETHHRFLIAGFGKEEKTIRTWIEAHPEKERITCLGTISRNQVYEQLAESDFSLVTFSAYKTLETNSPNKLFDAFTFGIPAITNKAGWIAELANETGGFFEESPEEAVKKVIGLKSSLKRNNKARNTRYLRSDYAKQVLTLIHKCG